MFGYVFIWDLPTVQLGEGVVFVMFCNLCAIHLFTKLLVKIIFANTINIISTGQCSYDIFLC